MATKRGFIGFAAIVMAGLFAVGSGIQAQAPAQQPEMKTLKVDFVPGEKTIFFDDFTDMTPGDAPAHFKTRGAAPELMAGGSVRQLLFNKNGSLLPNLTSLPKNFTYESELKFDTPNGWAMLTMLCLSKEREALSWSLRVRTEGSNVTLWKKVPKYEELARKAITFDLSQPVKVALWVQNGRVRIFVNGEKHLDVNQVDVVPIDKVDLQAGVMGGGATVGFRSVRFAESTPDFSQVINSSGRYVSHGILFDTNSDRLKPESAVVIQAIAKGLDTNPALKLLIEGHTDSVGNAASNLDLSKRRAEAVKSVLVSQFAVDAARLTTTGLGATKPIDSNDTPTGRSQNRRVEFVKQ